VEHNYFDTQEPRLLAVRVAEALQVAKRAGLPERAAIASFPTSVPLPNRAGKLTGRALTVDVEPGTLITSSTVVTARLDGPVVVDGAFHLSVDGSALDAAYTCGSDVPAVVWAWLPTSRRVEVFEGAALVEQVDAAIAAGEVAMTELVEQFTPLMRQKVARCRTRFLAAAVDDADLMQEMRLEMMLAVRKFASAARPNTSLFAYLDLMLWRACERVVKGSVWHDGVAELNAESAAVAAVEADAWRSLAFEAGLSDFEVAVMRARLEVRQGRRPTWEEVGAEVGVGREKARLTWGAAVAHLEETLSV
jgi:hypothetical protein